MKSPDDNVDHLLDAYFDQELDEVSRGELNEYLVSSTSVRSRFWERATLENGLEDWAENGRGETLAMGPLRPLTPPPPEQVAKAKASRLNLRLVALSGIAAVLLVCFGVMWGGGGGLPGNPSDVAAAENRSDESTPAASGPPGVAQVAKSSGLPSNGPFEPGRTLFGDRELRIPEGLLELEFYSGTRVFIEGPAIFTPESDMHLVLKEGRAQVDVSDSAQGFQLAMPDGLATDLGTKFEVAVVAGKTQRLQVTQGAIDWVGTRKPGEKRHMETGAAIAVSEAGDPLAIEASPLKIKDKLDALSSASDQRRFQAWDAASQALDADPSLSVHFRFLEAERGSTRIINHATAANEPKSGNKIVSQWSSGRWNRKAAVSFRNPGDRIRVDVPGEFTQATLIAWVKVVGLPRRYNGLFLSEFGIPGETHWQFSPEGAAMFGVRPRVERADSSFHRAFSEPILFPQDFGIWRMLAVSYDADRREVVHYIDGRRFQTSLIDDGIPIQFGRATLGNFFDPDPAAHTTPGLGADWSYRNWTGEIDEFMLYRRVLDAGEILRLHDLGSVR